MPILPGLFFHVNFFQRTHFFLRENNFSYSFFVSGHACLNNAFKFQNITQTSETRAFCRDFASQHSSLFVIWWLKLGRFQISLIVFPHFKVLSSILYVDFYKWLDLKEIVQPQTVLLLQLKTVVPTNYYINCDNP